uniref:Transposase Tc1-like domain-containing protein n=1 Tax=Heliothis virescens TaxID=7102 RepID=A0A2A4K090_HELVI
MPKRNELSLEKRVQIQLLHEQGKSQVDISKTVKCSRRSVQYAIQRFSATGSHQNRPRTGRKRITTDRQDRQLLRESLRNRKKTSSELAAEFSEQMKKTISARTTRRRLQEAGLKGCKARKKPWLSDSNKKARYEWALQHRTFTAEDWSNVVWSDESNFEVSKSI